MKAVMRELAQARRHHSTLPLFGFLRTEAIAPRDRLAFYPCMAPFVLALSDLNRFVFRDESSQDPHQELINRHTYARDHQWPDYLDDLARLGLDRSVNSAQGLRSYMNEDTRESRLLVPRLAQLVHGASAIEKLVVIEAMEQAADVLSGLTTRIAARIRADGGPELHALGRPTFGGEGAAVMHGLDQRVLEAITLTSLERLRCLDLAFRVFDLFADWAAELLAYAKTALAQRPTPRLIHSAHRSAVTGTTS